MPVLPSGLTLALTTLHIMKPDRNWFRAPEGHFWHTRVAVDETPPPFAPDSPVMEDLRAQGDQDYLVGLVLAQVEEGHIKRLDLCVAPSSYSAVRTGEYTIQTGRV